MLESTQGNGAHQVETMIQQSPIRYEHLNKLVWMSSKGVDEILSDMFAALASPVGLSRDVSS